jgi:hypothetical protein
MGTVHAIAARMLLVPRTVNAIRGHMNAIGDRKNAT